MDKCFPCLKWTSLMVSMGTAVLCIVLVGWAAIEKKDTTDTRVIMAILAGIGIPVSLMGTLATLRHNYFLFLVFYFYVFFHCFFGISIALKDKNYWFYPTLSWIVWLPLGLFSEELRALRKRMHHVQPL